MAETAPVEVEVEEGFVDVSQSQDGGLLKKILVEGEGDETPPSGSNVRVHYVGTLHSDGSKFDSSRDRPGFFEFDVGVGRVIKGWDQGICTMKKGEKCILRCRHDYAYGEGGSPPKIPGAATLNFEVELFEWHEKAPAVEDLSPEERRAYAMKLKDAGAAAYKKGDFTEAAKSWEDAVEFVTYDEDMDDEPHSHGGMKCSGAHGGGADGDQGPPSSLSLEDRAVAVALLNNLAMASLKLQDGYRAKGACDRVLSFDADNVKALFRRGQAEKARGNFGACVSDVDRLLQVDPDNKEAEQLRRTALAAEKQAKKNEKALYSKMFG